MMLTVEIVLFPVQDHGSLQSIKDKGKKDKKVPDDSKKCSHVRKIIAAYFLVLSSSKLIFIISTRLKYPSIVWLFLR